MKSLYIILGMLITFSIVSFGQSKSDIADFKEEFPKTEENVYRRIEHVICSYKKPHVLTRETPFVLDNKTSNYCLDYWYMSMRYCDKKILIRDWITLAEPLWKKDVKKYDEREYTKLRDNIVGRIPETWKDATHRLPRGTVVLNVWFFIFDDPGFDELGKFRTTGIRDDESLPIRFRSLYSKISSSEENKVRNFMTKRIKTGYAYAKVEIDGKYVFGWMPIRAIFSSKKM